MELFIIGAVFGGLIGWLMFWNRTRRLEDELLDKSILLDEAVEIIRRQRRAFKRMRSEDGETCDSGDLFTNW